jgi:hypothetical protein
MKIYGERTGNQPPGTMEWSIVRGVSLPGFPNTRTIQITYQISSGIQTYEHPNPGKPYYAVGFPRVCYLPDTDKGKYYKLFFFFFQFKQVLFIIVLII